MPQSPTAPAPFRLAYIILAHKNFAQLGMLVNAIKEDWNDIFIHVDARSDFDEEEFSRLCNFKKVTFVHPRIKIYWGHVSIVNATLELLACVNHQAQSYQRVVLISGQDLPIVSNARIYEFFRQHPTTEFLEFRKFPIPWWPYGGRDRVCVYNFPNTLGPRLNRVLRVIQMSLPFRRHRRLGLDFFGYSQWFNVTGDAARYIVQFATSDQFLKIFDYTFAPDEIFFQTILLNSSFRQSCVDRSLRYCVWPKGGSGPKVLREADLDHIFENTSGDLFARKFDDCVDPVVIKRLLCELQQKE